MLLHSMWLLAGLTSSVSTNTGARVLQPPVFGAGAGWAKLAGHAAAEPTTFSSRTLWIHLSQPSSGLASIKDLATRVSTPGDPMYGRHLSKQQIDALTLPAPGHAARVRRWLLAAGVGRDAITVDHHVVAVDRPTVEIVARLCGMEPETSYARFVHRPSGATAVRPVSGCALPAVVAPAVTAILGLYSLPLIARPRSAPPRPLVGAASGNKPSGVTPAVLAKTYRIGGVTPSANSTAPAQVAVEFQGEYFSQKHLSRFFQEFVIGSPPGSDRVAKVVGPNDNSSAGIEADLDVQYLMGVAPGLKTEFWSAPASVPGFCDQVSVWAEGLLKLEAIPAVHSVSYGFQGDPDDLGCPKSDLAAVDVALAKLAARGVSVIVASGDAGSGFRPAPVGKQPPPVLYPSWPASSPWVTAVGATGFESGKVGGTEVASSLFGSGGGYSALFGRGDATWQEGTAAGYLSSSGRDLPPQGSYPPGGRATPDVATLGELFAVVTGAGAGKVTPVSGTSAGTPVFAGMVALMNEARRQKGKPALGFLNPFLYSHPAAFTDVTLGFNDIGTAGEQLGYGWECSKGWDPVTGLGTPLFTELLAAALAV